MRPQEAGWRRVKHETISCDMEKKSVLHDMERIPPIFILKCPFFIRNECMSAIPFFSDCLSVCLSSWLFVSLAVRPYECFLLG